MLSPMSLRRESFAPASRRCACITALAVAAAMFGCSGDQSLGGGLPSKDGAAADDDARADEAGTCSNRAGVDAGSGLTSGLVLWYRCESSAATSASLLPDSSGQGNDGELVTGAGGSPGYSFAPGKVGNALDLSYTKQGYVVMPAGILANLCEVTVATWVYLNSNTNAFARIWDFGQDTTTYMFLTPITNIDNFARFAISARGNLHEQGIKAPMEVPTLKWTHVALVVDSTSATLYFDGTPVGTTTDLTLRPADLGPTLNNYIGRSQFPSDPYLDGDIDEFRVYSRALSPQEIQTLANGS
jgi:hypothetical protein